MYTTNAAVVDRRTVAMSRTWLGGAPEPEVDERRQLLDHALAVGYVLGIGIRSRQERRGRADQNHDHPQQEVRVAVTKTVGVEIVLKCGGQRLIHLTGQRV